MFEGSLGCFGSTAFHNDVVVFETIFWFEPLGFQAQTAAAILEYRIRLEARREYGLVRGADREVGAFASTRNRFWRDGAVVLEVVQIEKQIVSVCLRYHRIRKGITFAAIFTYPSCVVSCVTMTMPLIAGAISQ